MAQTTLADKLLIKPGTGVWLSDPALVGLLGTLPEGVDMSTRIGHAGVAVVFAQNASQLRGSLDSHRAELAVPGVLWVAYRKGNRTDINRDSLWPILAGYGLRPITQVAIDDEWSALRFRPPKPGEEAFTPGP